jgi:hypothetical protein
MRVDDRVACYRCGGKAHDLARHNNFEMTLQCCYCLAFTKVFGSPPDSPAKKMDNPGSYVLKYGRHKGSTIDSVAKLGDRGVEYLMLLSRESPKLKVIIDEYLGSRSAVSVKAAAKHPELHRSPSREEASITGSP